MCGPGFGAILRTGTKGDPRAPGLGKAGIPPLGRRENLAKELLEIEEETLDLRRYIGMFLSYWWLMLLLPVVGGVLGYFYSSNQERVYEARATLLVQQRRALSPTPSDFTLSEQLASTYGRLVRATPFLSNVVEDNELGFSADSLRGMVSARAGSNPPVLEIGVRDSDPVVAANTATVVADEFIDYVVEQRLAEIARLQSAAAAQGLSNVQDLVAAQFTVVDALSILEPVSVPSRPILPQTRQNVLLGILVGGILATGTVLLLSTLSDTVRNPEELSRRFGTISLGTIFQWSTQDIEESELVVWKYPSSGYSESFRQARANIQFATANAPSKLLMVTSPGPSEGKRTIICNLAVTLAQTGKTVTIVDGDLRRPSVHRRFEEVQRQPGLSTYLSEGEADVRGVMHGTEVEGV